MAAVRHPSESALQWRLRQVKPDPSSLSLLGHHFSAELLTLCHAHRLCAEFREQADIIAKRGVLIGIPAASQGFAKHFLVSTLPQPSSKHWKKTQYCLLRSAGSLFCFLILAFFTPVDRSLLSWSPGSLSPCKRGNTSQYGSRRRPRRHQSPCFNSEGRLVLIDRLCGVCSESFWLKETTYRWQSEQHTERWLA